MPHLRRPPLHALAVVTVIAIVQPIATGQSQAQRPSIRSRIAMVPLDVRVVDQNGNPVTDLKQEDFTVTENKVPQTIRHFATQSLAPAVPAETAPLPLRRATDAPLETSNQRVFLVLLGRGRMQGPSKELPALLDFVKTRLLPQDRIALLAYNRATDFTTRHDAVATVVERFRDRQPKIEQDLAAWFSGLRAVYGSKEIPPHIQAEIDALFEGAGSLRPREIRPGQITDHERIADDTRRNTDQLMRAEILKQRELGAALAGGAAAGLPDPEATATADRLDMSFDEYVMQQTELMHDLGNLYAGIDYLRFIDGEKHLVFVTPNGLAVERAEDGRNIALVASDARIAVDILYTGGVVGAPPPKVETTAGGGMRINMSPVPTNTAVFNQGFKIQTLRHISELTGGETTAFRDADYAFDRLDHGTRFQYLIGYYPSDSNWDGRLRRIEVKVNRPGVTLLYRRSYYATEQIVPLDRRQFVTTNRIEAAGKYQKEIKDIALRVKPTLRRGGDASNELTIELNVRSPGIAFTSSGTLRTATLDVAIYCGDGREKVVCESKQKMDLKFDVAGFERFSKEGASSEITVPVRGEPVYVKVIVYDYVADLLGSAAVKLR